VHLDATRGACEFISMTVFHEIQDAMTLLNEGMSGFITGAAGTGKTTAMKAMINVWKGQVALTATTNCAAKNMTAITGVDTQTIHAWSGIETENDVDKVMVLLHTRNEAAATRIKETDRLVVEEVSMLSSHMLHMLDRVFKNVRRCEKPFGGIQIIFVGDFYQLPPVEGSFCFQWEHWREYVPVVVVLQKVHRQADDSFVALLNEVREGQVSQKTVDTLSSKVVADPWANEMNICLFPVNRDADSLNSYRYGNLEGEEKKYDVVSFAGKKPSKFSRAALETLLDEMPARRCLKLKVGAKVICVANVDADLVNGSLGTVKAFKGGLPEVEFAHGIEVVHPFKWDQTTDGRTVWAAQIPLQLAWGISIHKGQGMTISEGGADLGKTVFAPAQSYVALSRFSSLDKCSLFAFDPTRITTDPAVVAYYESLR
jgi:ATP-dependent exoDNAse (exonuclease V) alpha subunit